MSHRNALTRKRYFRTFAKTSRGKWAQLFFFLSQTPALTITARRARCVSLMTTTSQCVCARIPWRALPQQESLSMYVFTEARLSHISFLSITLEGYKWGVAKMAKTSKLNPFNKLQNHLPVMPKSLRNINAQCHALLFTITSLHATGLRHWQQDLWLLLPLLCHKVCSGGHQEGPQAAPGLHWTLQM